MTSPSGGLPAPEEPVAYPPGAPAPGAPAPGAPAPGAYVPGAYVPQHGGGELPPYPPLSAPPADVEDPAPYHRLFRTTRAYAWWRPLVAVAVFVAFVVVAQLVIGVAWIVVMILTGGIASLGSIDQVYAELTDISNPVSLVILFGSIAVMLPLVPLAMLCAGLRPVGMRHSVAFRIRWRWMLWCAIPALVVTALSTGLSFLPLLFGETITPVPVEPATFALLAVIIVLLVPLQSAAEEYVFRGLIMQTLGAWVRSPWPGILVSTVIFTVGHTQYELWGLLSVGVMGLGFAILVWRTGGLEAGIAFHVVNNVVALVLLASGALGTTVMSSEGSGPLTPLVQLVFTAGYVVWVDVAARRTGLARARELSSTAS